MIPSLISLITLTNKQIYINYQTYIYIYPSTNNFANEIAIEYKLK
jgi:hypothetical protein